MNFKVGDRVVIRHGATEEQLDGNSNLRPGIFGIVREIARGDFLNICVEWPNNLFWWVSKEVLELLPKELSICDKVKTMYERQPYFQKMKALEVKIPKKKKVRTTGETRPYFRTWDTW